MTDPILDAETDAAVVADLARRAAAGPVSAADAIDAGVLVHLHRGDEQITVQPLEKYRPEPLAPRGGATLDDPDDFAAYVNRLADSRTTVWAHEAGRTVTAVFNDHPGALVAGWRDHTAALTVRVDPDWQAWLARNGKLGPQEDFAEFIEQNFAVIVDPSAATMLEVAATFHAVRSSTYERVTRLASGDVQMRYHEDTKASAGAKGHIEIPAQFTVRIAPFIGADPVDIIARLRYRIREGTLAIGYQLHRPDKVEREAFENVVARVNQQLDGPPVYLGAAPRALR